MKSTRLAKRETQFAAAETALLNLLAQVLPRVVQTGEMLFFNSEFLPDTIRPHWLPQESEALQSLANDAVALREELGLSVVGTVGQLSLSACHESANYTDGNRRGHRQLATGLLGELGSNISFKVDGFAAA